MTTDYEKFQKALEKHPQLLEAQARREELRDFKKQYGVDKRTKLCCPVCTLGWNRGKLYQSVVNPEVFVCKNCKLVLVIRGISITTEEILATQEKPGKGD